MLHWTSPILFIPEFPTCFGWLKINTVQLHGECQNKMVLTNFKFESGDTAEVGPLGASIQICEECSIVSIPSSSSPSKPKPLDCLKITL